MTVVSQDGTTGSGSQAVDYAANRAIRAQSHMRKEPVMRSLTRFVGLDVHAESIAIAVADGGGVRSLGVIPNSREAVRKLVRKLGPAKDLRVCYEAGPCGYVLYWQLAELGVKCDVAAPSLIPTKAGDRVKTDRRDAEKLARCYKNGDLAFAWVPDAEHEALRDLVRARLVAKEDQRRARHRLVQLLLRHGVRKPEGMTSWKRFHRIWLNQLRFGQHALQLTLEDYLAEVDHAAERVARLEAAIDAAVDAAPAKIRDLIRALQCLRGVARTTAAIIAVEAGDLSRFQSAPELMSYAGAVPSERSSGGKTSRGSITKTGNGHLRRVLVEAAWAYRYRPAIGPELRRREQCLSATIREISWKAQHRLHSRYVKLLMTGKHTNVAVTAVARELLGFVWAIGKEVERGGVSTATA
jgi:transposase